MGLIDFFGTSKSFSFVPVRAEDSERSDVSPWLLCCGSCLLLVGFGCDSTLNLVPTWVATRVICEGARCTEVESSRIPAPS